MLFSRVKISSFRAKAHLVFHWCLYNKKGVFSQVDILQIAVVIRSIIFLPILPCF